MKRMRERGSSSTQNFVTSKISTKQSSKLLTYLFMPFILWPMISSCQCRFTSKLHAICEFNFVDRKCPPAHHTDHSGIRDVFHFTEIVQTGEKLLLGTFSGSTLSD